MDNKLQRISGPCKEISHRQFGSCSTPGLRCPSALKYSFSLLSALPGSDISHSGGAVQILLLATPALLFLPKIFAMFLAIPKAQQFGGAFRLAASTLIETAIWTLLAPVVMLSYTQFVVTNLAGLAG